VLLEVVWVAHVLSAKQDWHRPILLELILFMLLVVLVLMLVLVLVEALLPLLPPPPILLVCFVLLDWIDCL
jgi:hypothetical protein